MYTPANGVLPLFLFCLYSNIFATPLICFVHVWQTGAFFPTGDPIVPFVISPRFECLNKLTPYTWHLWGTCLLYCDQMLPNYRISLVGYHCSIEFPSGVPLFYCCKYPTVPHNLWRMRSCTCTCSIGDYPSHNNYMYQVNAWEKCLQFLVTAWVRFNETRESSNGL